LSTLDLLFHPFDIVLFCNAANAFLTWIPRLRGMGVVINVDGIERLREKWSRLGKEFYRFNELLATWFPNRVVTDARAIQDYYRVQYRAETCFIPYGAPAEKVDSKRVLEELGLRPFEYLLYVSRLEPENNAHRVMEGYLRSGVTKPLVLVGDAPYGEKYKDRLRALADGENILMPGAIYGAGYRELLSHCICYLHGCAVGGTHPALLEAMGAGALVISNETPENREVVGDTGLLCSFEDVEALSNLVERAVSGSPKLDRFREKAQERIRSCYSWERVTDQYEELFNELAR
jgi:glycosyltransferase involved in cell wall biosynthesis